MLTDVSWETVQQNGTAIKRAILKPDENGWNRTALIFPPNTRFEKNPSRWICVITFLSGHAMYNHNGDTLVSSPDTKVRVGAGETFAITDTMTEVMWVISAPPLPRRI